MSDGGIAVALAEMALAGNIGAVIDRGITHAPPAHLFAEDQGLYLATVADASLLDVLSAAQSQGVAVEPIGRTAGARLIFELDRADHCIPLAELRAVHEGFFPQLMGAKPSD